MKIAILGAGFSGLAVAWHLLQKKEPIEVVLFDPHGIGGGASGVSAGLLHPFAGLHAKLNRFGYEGLSATLQLLEASKSSLGYSPYIISGILRPALTLAQAESYISASKNYPDEILWLDQKQLQLRVPGVAQTSGIYIPNGITVYSKTYLEGLWNNCKQLGAKLENKAIDSLEALTEFDTIVITMGAQSSSLKEFSHLPINCTKGQILEIEWPNHLPPLPMPINSHVYCLMLPDRKRCLVGATYERKFTSTKVDWKIATEEILPRLAELYPPLKEPKVIDCRTGIRVSAKNHMPLLQKISNRCYILTGMGSKGLLYHAYYSKLLSDMIFTK